LSPVTVSVRVARAWSGRDVPASTDTLIGAIQWKKI
jgi:hypothetical protein